jgi:transposase
MRGQVDRQPQMFHVFSLEEMVPADHPLRGIKVRVDRELTRLRPRLEQAYAADGRPSIPPEQLIKATLLQALYSIRSERQLCEQIQYNMLYRWFLELAPDAEAWNHSTFSKNRERFAEHDLMGEFFRSSVAAAVREGAASREHFSVDGSLIEAWASMKSIVPRADIENSNDNDKSDRGDPPTGGGGGSNRWVDWRGEKRSNATHASRTDPEAMLARKGTGREARLSHSLHALMENRHGLIADIEVEPADGHAERRAALALLKRTGRRRGYDPKTAGMDAGYDDGKFLHAMKELGIQPHAAVRDCPKVINDLASLARFDAWMRKDDPGPTLSRKKRMRVEEIFGWLKTIAGLRKARFAGRWKIQWYAQACAATWNFLRLTRLAMAG